MDIIRCDHQVISDNTAAMVRLVTVLEGIQNTQSLLVTQVTTSIAQRNEGVPLRVVLILIGGLMMILFTLIGLDAANLLHIGSIP